jgi:DNA polymerase-1
MPIQGSAADIIKLAMIKIHEAIEGEKLNCRLILQVHDELVFDCRKDSVKDSQIIIKEIMEGVIELKVPIKVSIKSGDNWLGA